MKCTDKYYNYIYVDIYISLYNKDEDIFKDAMFLQNN